MKKKLYLFSVPALLALAGCNPSSDTPPIDQNAAKSAPGANTPAAQPAAVNQAQVRADKSGK